MPPRCVFSPEAEQDLLGIYAFIAAENQPAALGVITDIERACEVLSDNPLAGRARPEFSQHLRSFPVGRYIIFYFPSDLGIKVVRLFHVSRDYEDFLL